MANQSLKMAATLNGSMRSDVFRGIGVTRQDECGRQANVKTISK